MPRCIIVSNGVITDYSFYKSQIQEDDYVICADGGIKHVLNLNRLPDLWLGDFDSCRFSELIKNTPGLNNVEIISLNPVKDVTDTHYACIEAIKRGYKNITVWGACGGRTDHMLSNIHLLEFLSNNGIDGIIQDEKNTIKLCKNKIELTKERKYLSLIPLDKKVVISGTTGLKYSLSDFALERQTSIGVSNEIINNKASVFVEDGHLLVIESDD